MLLSISIRSYLFALRYNKSAWHKGNFTSRKFFVFVFVVLLSLPRAIEKSCRSMCALTYEYMTVQTLWKRQNICSTKCRPCVVDLIVKFEKGPDSVNRIINTNRGDT